jgi:O-antigen ligase
MALASTILASTVYGTVLSAKVRKLTFVSAYLLLCASLLWISLGEDLGRTAQSIAALGRGEEGASSVSTLSGRVPLWNEELGYVRARPVLGYGYNAFLSPHNLRGVSQNSGWVPASPHSAYIGTLLDLGYLGAATFVLVLLLGLRRSLSLARNGPGAAFAAAVMIWLCCNLFLESGIIMEPTLPTFISMVIFASLSFKENGACPSVRFISSRRFLTRMPGTIGPRAGGA